MTTLSVVLPFIRPDNLVDWYNSLKESVVYDFEVIALGPQEPPPELEGKLTYIKCYGSPNYCVQFGSVFANGNFITWSSDDGIYVKGAIKQLIDLLTKKRLENGNNLKYVGIVRYTEHASRQGQEMADWWYYARSHQDQCWPLVKHSYKIAPVGMYYTKYFRQLGGLHCGFEHINMSTHLLAFKAQEDGAELLPSPVNCMNCLWQQGDWGPVGEAYNQNDAPLFRQICSGDKLPEYLYSNWMLASPLWCRRFK